MPAAPPSAAAPAPAPAPRLLRLRAYELLIFSILFVLLGLCLAAARLAVPAGPAGSPGVAGGGPEKNERR